MESYKLEWKNSAEQDLHNIDPKYVSRVVNTVELLEDNPFPIQHRKLKGSEREYRIRVGDYRVIYEVDTHSRTITIYHVRHRKDAYSK